MRIIDDVVIHAPVVSGFALKPALKTNDVYAYSSGLLTYRLAYHAKSLNLIINPRLRAVRGQTICADILTVVADMHRVSHRYIGKTLAIYIPVTLIVKNLFNVISEKDTVVVEYMATEHISPDDTRVCHCANEFEHIAVYQTV